MVGKNLKKMIGLKKKKKKKRKKKRKKKEKKKGKTPQNCKRPT